MQFETASHSARMGISGVLASMMLVFASEIVRNQDFNRLANQLLFCVAKHLLGLEVRQQYQSRPVDNDDGVGRGFQKAGGTICHPESGLYSYGSGTTGSEPQLGSLLVRFPPDSSVNGVTLTEHRFCR